MRLHYAIVYVSDMSRAFRFYRDSLGLAARFESPGWSELTAGDVTIALHAAEASAGPGGSHRPQAGRATLGLRVPDLDAFHRDMVAKEVPCIQEPRLVFGAKVAQYADPDGLVFSVGEEPRTQGGSR
jgi:catechol 2,3-dioxygenase-like lactoylglutathione lyase family enzyme